MLVTFVVEKMMLCFSSGKLTRLSFLITKWHTVWKLWKFTLTLFWQKSRESNGFSKEVTNELISRIIYQQDVRVNFSILNTVCFFSFTWGRNLNPKSGAIRVLNADKTMTFLIYLWDIPFCQSCLKVLSNLEILYIVRRRRKGWLFFQSCENSYLGKFFCKKITIVANC